MVTMIKKGTSKEKIDKIIERRAKVVARKINIKKYCGVIKLNEDPLHLQKKWRNEWE